MSALAGPGVGGLDGGGYGPAPQRRGQDAGGDPGDDQHDRAEQPDQAAEHYSAAGSVIAR